MKEIITFFPPGVTIIIAWIIVLIIMWLFSLPTRKYSTKRSARARMKAVDAVDMGIVRKAKHVKRAVGGTLYTKQPSDIWLFMVMAVIAVIGGVYLTGEYNGKGFAVTFTEMVGALPLLFKVRK